MLLVVMLNGLGMVFDCYRARVQDWKFPRASVGGRGAVLCLLWRLGVMEMRTVVILQMTGVR